jgi:hypothetical protein
MGVTNEKILLLYLRFSLSRALEGAAGLPPPESIHFFVWRQQRDAKECCILTATIIGIFREGANPLHLLLLFFFFLRVSFELRSSSLTSS